MVCRLANRCHYLSLLEKYATNRATMLREPFKRSCVSQECKYPGLTKSMKKILVLVISVNACRMRDLHLFFSISVAVLLLLQERLQMLPRIAGAADKHFLYRLEQGGHQVFQAGSRGAHRLRPEGLLPAALLCYLQRQQCSRFDQE